MITFAATIYLPMETLSPNQRDGSYPGYVEGEANALVPGVLGKAVHTGGEESSINYGAIPNACLAEPNLCPDGLTISVWIHRMSVIIGNEYYITNGGHKTDNSGFSINGARIDDPANPVNVLSFLLKTKDSKYFVNIENAPDDRWMHLVMTWHPTHGLICYIDAVLVGQKASGWYNSLIENPYRNFTIGRPNHQYKYYAVFTIDEFMFWDSFKTAEFVQLLYDSYSRLHVLSLESYSTFKVEENISVVNVSAIRSCHVAPFTGVGVHPCRLECLWMYWCTLVLAQGNVCHFFNIVSHSHLMMADDGSSIFIKL